MKKFFHVAFLLLALSPLATQATLIEGQCNGTVIATVTCDTVTGYEWLDLTSTENMSINAFLADLTFAGWTIADRTLVSELFVNAGFTNLSGITTPEDQAAASAFVALFGITYTNISGNFTYGVGYDGNNQSLPFMVAFSGPSQGAANSTGGTIFANTSDVRDSSFNDIGIWAYRSTLNNPEPVPEPLPIALFLVGLACLQLTRSKVI